MAQVVVLLVELLLQGEDVVDLCQLYAQVKPLPQVRVGDKTCSGIWSGLMLLYEW